MKDYRNSVIKFVNRIYINLKSLYLLKVILLSFFLLGMTNCTKSGSFGDSTLPSSDPTPTPSPTPTATPTPSSTPTPTATPSATPTPCAFTPTNNMSATYAIGQSDLTSSTANQGLAGPTAQTLAGPDGVSVANGKLFVGDFSNHRYLIFNGLPTSNNTSANLVLGQADFTTVSGAVTGGITSAGREAAWTGSQLILADGWNARLLVYNSFPTSNGQSADLVIGQPDFVSNTAGTSASQIDTGYGGIHYNANKLWLADVYNNRVIGFDTPITANAPSASIVIGHSNFTSSSQGSTANDFNAPPKAITYGGKMIIADRWNSRVLIYNSIPTASDPAADVVIGQTNLTNSSANQGLGSPTANTLNHPHSVAVDDSGRLYISDTLNHRVLVYNSIPTSNNAAADVVLGQANFTGGTANAGGSAAANTINRTTDLVFYNCSLVVGDQANNRVLIFQ